MRTGRPRLFNREEVLEKTIPVFWKRGFSDTTLADLEAATGVNRSGLYSEFKDKEDLFLESLRHYLKTNGLTQVLEQKPYGWSNIECYLARAMSCWPGQRGCFSVSSVRELEVLPEEARAIVAKSLRPIRRLLMKNIEAEGVKGDIEGTADMLMTFFAGISIEQNLAGSSAAGLRRVESIMRMMRSR